MKYVQYSDESRTEIVAVFSCSQDEDVYPHGGVVDDNDPMLIAFMMRFEASN